MTNDILLISKETGFMIKSLVKNLADNGFATEAVEPITSVVCSKLTGAEGEPFMLLLYADEFVSAASAKSFLLMIKSLCEEKNKMLCVIGYNREIDAIEEVIPSYLISCKIVRPFAMNDLIEKLQTAMKLGVERTRKKSILLVDDDMMFLKMMQNWLSAKYFVSTVKTGMQAITYIAKNTPDLILLDYDMPITPGPQVLEMIRDDPNTKDLPVIFLTGKSDRESIIKVMQLKPQGYILKSGSQQDIIRTVDEYFLKHAPKSSDGDIMLM